MPDQRKLPHTALCYVLLALITVAVYLPVIELNFVTFDDTYYVTNNPKVQAGLTWASACAGRSPAPTPRTGIR